MQKAGVPGGKATRTAAIELRNASSYAERYVSGEPRSRK
jgi:hypothetical protein